MQGFDKDYTNIYTREGEGERECISIYMAYSSLLGI